MSHIISIGSFRRGVGKSVISASLAVHTVQMGWRVGLAELDYVYPTSQKYLFDLPDSTPTLADYLRGKVGAGSVGVNVLAERGGTGELWVFPWGSSSAEDAIDPGVVNQGLQALRLDHNLDVLILDMTSGFGDFNLLIEAICDRMMIVMRLDHMDYQGTATIVETARLLDMTSIQLIVNQVMARHDPAQVKEQVEAAYGVPASILPFAEDLLGGGLAYPHHPWSQAVGSIAASLLPTAASRMAGSLGVQP